MRYNGIYMQGIYMVYMYTCCSMYIVAYMSWEIHIHTIDEFTESNIGIAG